MHRRFRPLMSLIAATMAILLGSIGWLQYQQWVQVEHSLQSGTTSSSWNFFQFELEHLKLRHQLDQVLHDPPQASHMVQLAMRYQIFASRFDLIGQGSSAELLRQHGEYKSLYTVLKQVLQDYDPYLGVEDTVPAFDASRLEALKRALDNTSSSVQALLLASVNGHNHQTTRHLQVIREQLLITTASSTVLALLALIFGGLALRQLTLAMQRHDELEKLHEEVSERAIHDTLTNLLNRGEFDRRLQHVFEACQQDLKEHAVLFIDLDRFKIINDTCGHAAGDILLREVASLLAHPIRSSDTLARLGGDEFGIILTDCGVQRAQQLAEKMCELVDSYRFVHATQRFHIGASIGLVMVHPHWSSTSAILQAADSACYVAKAAGRNRVHVYQDADHDVQTYRGHMHWVQRLGSALDENRLVLYWQRIVRLQAHNPTDGIKGEVLVRLREGNELIAPGQFLPVAERYGLATRIDRWVVNEVFNWMERHTHELHQLAALAVNLSGQSVGDPTFHQFVLEQLEHRALPTDKLVFEITETSAITNLSASVHFIEALKNHRVKVSLDDFGSGMSSFGYLKGLPVDYLKIDGQFMHHLSTDTFDQVTVKAICEVARATNKHTIAEWIDNEQVADMLRSFGVDYGQGYLWHRPAPLDTLLTHAPPPTEPAPLMD
jgi:diguanylate cyclase (GGDEF)-like protein